MFRLGVPSLVFMLLLDPLTNVIRDLGTGDFPGWASLLRRYPGYLASGSFLGASGPLWFAVALLVFSLIYAVVRLIASAIRGSGRFEVVSAEVELSPKAVHRTAVVLMAVIAAGSFLVRQVQPFGTSWYNMQLCFFPQYIVLFVVGLWAGRRGFLRALPRKAGMMWLRLAFIVGVPTWFLLFAFGGALSGNQDAFGGGLHWQAGAYAAWEAFFAVSVSIGLLTLYREKANIRNQGTGLLADTSFGIYVFHSPILVAVCVMIRSVALYPLAKAFVAATLGFGLSLAFAWALGKVPGLKRVFA